MKYKSALSLATIAAIAAIAMIISIGITSLIVWFFCLAFGLEFTFIKAIAVWLILWLIGSACSSVSR